MDLHGVLPAVTTPFRDGQIATERLQSDLARYEPLGLAGYLVLGSTGEAVLLEDAERALVLRAAREAIPAGKSFLAGVSAESLCGALRQSREAAACGADAVLVSTPHYFRAQMTAEAVREHYRAVADGSPVPVLLYNVPKFTGIAINADTVADLAEHPNIVGIKDSSGDAASLRKIRSRTSQRFAVLCGAADLLCEALTCGASGAVLAAAAAIPEPFVDLARRHADGDVSGAREVQEGVRGAAYTIAGLHGVPGVKAAMDLRGLHGGDPRRPLRPLPEAARAAIRHEVEQLVARGHLAGREI